MKHLILFVGCICLCTNHIFSQSLVEEVDTIQVTTTQIPLKSHETGRNVTVVTGEQLSQMAATSIDEMLQFLPGVEVQSRGGFGVQGDILMRGSTFTQVLVLIDGLKMNDPLTAHFNSNIPVAPGEIERIEVLRGPAAAMYGPDAVGGVINIITKVFSENNPESSLNTEVGVGSNSHIFGNVSGYHTTGDLEISGGFNLSQSDGALFPEENIDGTLLSPYRNDFDVKTAGLSVGYKMSNGYRLKFRSGYDDRDFDARYFYTTSTFDKSREHVTNWFNALRLDKVRSNSITDLQVSYKRGTDEFIFSPDFPSTNFHTTDYLNTLLNHQMVFSENFSLKVGAQFDQRSIESNDRGDHQDTHLGLYTMGVFRPDDHWNLSASLRADYDQNYDFEVSPQVNASFVTDQVIIRASAGRSIRAADYTERYVSNNLMSLTPGRSLGNPDLLAEQSWSEEVGVDVFLSRQWTLRSTAFFRQSSRLIDYVPTSAEDIGDVGDLQDGETYFFAQNISDVNTSGFELESHYRKQLGQRSQLNIIAGYTYLNTSNEEDVISVYLANHARHLVTVSAGLKTGIIDFQLDGLFKQRNERVAQTINANLEASYSVWNVRAGVNLNQNFGLDIKVLNIADAKYQNILGARMPGRWFMFSARYRI